jgi:predicted nucleic acid-binding protein
MFVLDASVAVKWFIVEPDTKSALEVARAVLRGDGPFFVPELFYYEVFSVTTKRTNAGVELTPRRMRWLADLPLRRVPLTPALADAMAPLVAKGLSGYDAAYAALAKLTKSRWLTFDTRARKKLGNPAWIIDSL